jgi:hypothetical protein
MLFDGGDEAAVFGVDGGHVTDDLGDAHVGYVFGANDAVETGGFHLAATEAEGGEVREAGAEFSDDLGAVVVAAGFAGREEDARIGVGRDGTSVDFSGGDCMARMAAKRFRAVLEPLGDELRWVVARVPFDVKTAWKTMVRLRVKLGVGGEVFRTSLFADFRARWAFCSGE